MKRLKALARRLKNNILPKKVSKDYLNQGERYDPNIASYFDQCHVSRYDFVLSYLTGNEIIIDIACGTGWGTAVLSKKCKSITGVDIAKDAIAFAKKTYATGNTKFVVSDFFKFAEKGDVIVSFETLEHIQADSFEKVVNKAASLANKIVIGSVPYEEIPGNNHFHLSFQLNESNFDSLKRDGILSFFYQDSTGFIHESKENIKPQNLIFVFKKRSPKE